jgi:hypothetical protein
MPIYKGNRGETIDIKVKTPMFIREKIKIGSRGCISSWGTTTRLRIDLAKV